MDIFSIITLFGGLAFFLYGMTVMSDGLEKSANKKLNQSLHAVTKNKFFALLFGAGMTIAVQSSSAVTVMLVGLVNSGLLEFGQTIGILMGSNIGTTLTAWILSLAGIDSDVVWMNLLKPANFSPIFALVGILMIMASKNKKRQNTGSVLIGFAILMFGMTLMSDSMKPLSNMPEFQQVLTAFKNPLLSVAVGAAFTGIIQSSAASVAILQSFSIAGGVTYGMAIPIIMGQNIGTCVTALISSIGVSNNAKKVAVVHLSFNIFGTLICLVPFYLGNAIFDWAFVDIEITPFMIAVVHSIFNVVTTLILLPFSKQLERLANAVIKDKEDGRRRTVILDERILSVPSVAAKRAFDLTVDMCYIANDSFLKAIDLITSYNDKTAEEIVEMEAQLNHLEDNLSSYMAKLSEIGMADEDSRLIAKMLHTIDDFERIGNHSVNLKEAIHSLAESNQSFSENATYELGKLTVAVRDMLEITSEMYSTSDVELASSIAPLNQVIKDLILQLRRNHIIRLQRGICTKELGFVLSDVLTACGRVAVHCANVAVAVIGEAQVEVSDAKQYLHSVKPQSFEEYQAKYDEYMEKYSSEIS